MKYSTTDMEETNGSPTVIKRNVIDEIDDETISYCEREGSRYIDGQVQVGREIRNKSMAFLGMITAVLVTLTSTAIINIGASRTGSLTFFLNLYGIMSFGTIAYKLIKGTIYDKPVKLSGNSPSYILQEAAIDYVKKHRQKPEESYRYIVAMQLNSIQEKIEFNKKVNQKMQENFKTCIKLLYVFAILVLPLLLLCWIVE